MTTVCFNPALGSGPWLSSGVVARPGLPSVAMRRLAALTLLALAACSSSSPRDADAYRTAVLAAHPTLDDTQLAELEANADTMCDSPTLDAHAREAADAWADGFDLVAVYDATFTVYCPDRADDWRSASAALDAYR